MDRVSICTIMNSLEILGPTIKAEWSRGTQSIEDKIIVYSWGVEPELNTKLNVFIFLHSDLESG